MMKDKFSMFFNKWNGKPCEVNDPSNLNQCMDLAYAWCDAIEISRDTIRHLYASQIYTNPNDLTIRYFELIPNTALAVPKVGDIVVFKGGTAGHVSIANGTGDTNTFQSFDQNWNTTSDDWNNKCVTIIHAYENVLGFLRVRTATEITDQTILPIIDSSGREMEVQAVRSLIADQERRIVGLLNEKDKLLQEIDILKITNNGFTSTIETLNQKIADLEAIPSLAYQKLKAIYDVFYGSGWWWQKWAKIKALLPQQP